MSAHRPHRELDTGQNVRDFVPAEATIVGLARSGIAAARLLGEKGVKLFLSDSGDPRKVEFMLASNKLAQLDHEAGEHTERVLDADAIIVSPGVPSDIPILREARRKHIPVWSELELAYRMSKATYCAVTGSSGKSTTVSLLGSIMKAAGREHVVAGNIGVPLSQVAPQIGTGGYVVAEVSSFQLETIDLFRPRVAAILNLMKNHLDRYEHEHHYYEAKKTIARNMTDEDTLVLNCRDNRLTDWAREIGTKTTIAFFGGKTESGDCVWSDGGTLHARTGTRTVSLMGLDDMKITGEHNWDNAAAAAAMALALGIDHEAIAEGLGDFGGLPHRLEFVREVDGVKYYNDSKATTAESVVCAISSFSANVHLIAGGRDKGCDYAALRQTIREHVKSVTLIGEAAEMIYRKWKGLADISIQETLEDAVGVAREKAVRGDIVLLSPACSSFDMFANFEKRGEAFRNIVNTLREAQ
jgi:UDP-N-acetylmuramoylalanine--D-glutamate ligase